MKRFALALAVSLLANVSLASESASYSLDVDVSPTGQAGGYMCKATVKDLDSGKVLSAPAIQLTAGSPAAAKTTDGDLVSELRVSVDAKTSRAIAELKVSRAGKVVAAQKSSIAIR